MSSTTGETVWSNYWPGSGADSDHPVKAFVYDDPNQLFQIATSNVVAAANTEAEVRAAYSQTSLLQQVTVVQQLLDYLLQQPI